MKLALVKQYGSLLPATAQDSEFIDTVKQGEVITAEFKKMRNGKFHRKFFALLNLVFENQEKYEVLEDILTELKIRIGHYKTHVLPGGELIYKEKSISFAKMDQREFEIFYNKALNELIKMIPIDRDYLVNQLVYS